jgi:hypothetical protein
MDDPRPPEVPPDFGQNLAYQRREWRVERVGWLVIAGLILAAMLGLLGDGPLSSTSADSPDGSIHLEFQRFGRVTATQAVRLRFRPVADADRRYRVWISGPYRDANRVREISPTPERVEDDRGRVVYVFRALETERSTEVTFYVQPRAAGLCPGRIGLIGGDSVAFRQFIYP